MGVRGSCPAKMAGDKARGLGAEARGSRPAKMAGDEARGLGAEAHGLGAQRPQPATCTSTHGCAGPPGAPSERASLAATGNLLTRCVVTLETDLWFYLEK
uniref:Uncharacterized protein n=1 Tax=Rangifer tarandus platyrhynchus TaxID=3082113 RepID=A0ACB0FE79_RANTA|nr:unnamed protein product [Rangifer tarandus platyrhynchus]